MRKTTGKRIFRNLLALYRAGYVVGRATQSGKTPLFLFSLLHVNRGNVATIILDETDHRTTMHVQDPQFEGNRKAIEEIAQALADKFFETTK